ncbi:alpha/beta fold hydrolase [Rubritepida flocculans]|uniref:alpha/beta fold hydrolase n=1 Tax=Rubritepida flocculans TaxID=182403 RepID=UPI000A069AEB|nr:alpha/beta fold hydrolase [Rubritepida flocculans]
MSPPPRRGPRPLPLHLMLGGMRGLLALTMPPPSAPGLPSWSAGWPRSKAGQAEAARIAARLAELQAAGQSRAPELFRAAVLRRLWRQDAALLRGIAAYRRHPHRRALEDPPVLWREGAARLLDYGGRGRPVLFVPSLVNRAHVLDLDEGASLLRFLRANGVRPLLLDWGWPGEAERRFTLTDHIAGRLERAIQAAPRNLVLAGYCMGGLLALAAALRQPGRVRALALLATPWDFHADSQAAGLARLLPGLEPLMEPAGALPVDALQWLFALLDPYGVGEKFRAFGRLDPASARARRFVAIEDWLNDGVPLAAPVAREAIRDWYGRNAPMRGEWAVAGLPVTPAAWRGPAFLAIPARDRIVPPASARPLAAALPAAALHVAEAGHVGMVAGMGAEAALWRPLLGWIRAL